MPSFRRLLVFGLLTLAVFFLIPAVLYDRMGIIPFLEGPSKILREMLSIRKMNLKPEAPGQNVVFLVRSMTWPVFAAALAGIFLSLLRRRPDERVYLIWFAVFFLYQMFVILNKEARYLFPLLPPLYFFSVSALKSAYKKICRWPLVATPVFTFLVLSAACAPAGLAAFRECLKFRDPVYTADYARKLSLTAVEWAEGHQIFWLGKMYPLHDRDFWFDADDEATYIYHFYNHVVAFYAHKSVRGFEDPEYYGVAGGPEGPQIFALGAGSQAANGDVMIMNLEKSGYETRTMPEVLQPLLMARVKTIEFQRSGKTADGADLFEAPGYGQIVMTPQGGGFEVAGSGLTDGYFELYFSFPKTELRLSMSLLKVEKGRFRQAFKRGVISDSLGSLLLLTYDKVKVFPQP